MSEGRPISNNDLFDFEDDSVIQDKKVWNVGGKPYCSKQDIKGNQVKTQLGWGAKMRVKP